MKKVTLVCLNSKFIHTSLGIWYIREYCKADAEFCMLDTFVNRKTKDIANEIIKSKPDIVGFSVYIFNVEKTVEVAKIIKNAGIHIVFGGPEATYNKDIWEYADQIILGEGEIAWHELLKEGNTSRLIEGIPVEELIYPYTEEYFKNAKNRIVYFEASRGCPFSCAYCMSCNTRLNQFDFDSVTRELLKFKNHNIRLIKFVDRTFNANRRYATKLINWIIDNFSDDNIRFHFEVAPELFDEDLFNAIKRAKIGLFQFEIGMQSFNPKSLKAVNRNMDIENSAKNIKKIVDFKNCHVHTDLIVGLPYEDLESFKYSFNQLYKLNAQQLQVGFLKILKGSELERNLPNGYIVGENAPYEIIETPWLSAEEVKLLKQFEVAVENVFNSHRFESTIQYGLLYNTPFDFYYNLSKYIEKSSQMFLIYKGVYDFMADQGFDMEIINELLKFDYLKSNPSKNLPPVIKRHYDPQFKSKVKSLKQKYKGYRFYQFFINPETIEKTPCIIAFNTKSNDKILNHYDYVIFNNSE